MISLAMTDLLVGVLAPFNTLRFCFWEFGTNMCNFITSMVVILLSASIYHFVCVNIDRKHNITQLILLTINALQVAGNKIPNDIPRSREQEENKVRDCILLDSCSAARHSNVASLPLRLKK